MPYFARSSDMNALMDCMHSNTSYIIFNQHELSPLEVQSQANPLMIIASIDIIGISHTLVDTTLTLNVCSFDLLPKIKIDPSFLPTTSLFISRFD